VALGAFLIGAIIAEAREIHRIEALTEPVRDMFSAIFFVTIGLLIDPKMLAAYWLPVYHHAGGCRGESRHLLVRRVRGGNEQPHVVARRHGLAQIGEFSFNHRVARLER